MSSNNISNENNKLIPRIISKSQSQNNISEINNRRKPHTMIRSYTFDDIITNETNWSEDIKKYNYNKKILPWGYNPRPQYIKEEIIKSLDTYFNPITQKYKDKEYDNELRKLEKKDIIDKISLNYDKELRVIQTYDIINLQDKLKGFENHPDYPKYKKNNSAFKKINHLSTKENYNIISNISLSQHHYDKPENRPKYDLKSSIGRHIKKINFRNYKDYNIISNKYNEYDKEKKDIDRELQKIEASKKFCKSMDYDIIKGIYVDSEKEKKYQEERKNKIEELKYIKRDTVFNPFNNEIFDKEKLEEENKKLKNRVYRYSIRPQIENYHHALDLRKDNQKINALKTKLIYQRFKYSDKRGYDFITGKDKYNSYKNSLDCKSIKRPWEIIKDGVNDNETISKKNLYLCYDKDDINQRYNECKIKREKMIKDLPKIENEDIFKIKQYPHKIKLNILKNNNLENNNIRYENQRNYMLFNLDKNIWFSQDKNNNYIQKK